MLGFGLPRIIKLRLPGTEKKEEDEKLTRNYIKTVHFGSVVIYTLIL